MADASSESRTCRFAGSFFSGNARELGAQVTQFLSDARAVALSGRAEPCAIVAPHAGYRFSGQLTGISYAAVNQTPRQIVVLSPSHRHGFAGIAFPSQSEFATPTGPVPIDRDACDLLAARGLAHQHDPAHDNEHGIETQLPFIRALWPGVPVLPLVIGDAEPTQIAAGLDALPERGQLVVISSDLSHFLDQQAARTKDHETARLIETGIWDKLTPGHACGVRGLQGWMSSKAGQGSKPLRLAMDDSARSSGDTARVVGYGAWGFYPIDADMLTDVARHELLVAARRGLAHRLEKWHVPNVSVGSFIPPLQGYAASFVTLTHQDRLRGCIGSLAAHQPLVVDTITNAQKAALNDPRFAPVGPDLLPELRIKIAVLSRAKQMDIHSEADALQKIVPGQDGLILTSAGRRGLFLPMVWESLPAPREFLRQLKRKAGLPEDHWSKDLTLHRFRAESFAEAA